MQGSAFFCHHNTPPFFFSILKNNRLRKITRQTDIHIDERNKYNENMNFCMNEMVEKPKQFCIIALYDRINMNIGMIIAGKEDVK